MRTVHTLAYKTSSDLVGGQTIEGEGHAHLYLDGAKVARVYGEWYHLPKLEGEHKLRVTLNTNDHQDYTVAGEVVGPEKKIGVSAREKK